jgi:hypothetical protein
VAVTVRIEHIERDGDTWRADATLGAAGDLPIVGLAGSGIPGDRIEEGRSARIIGLVKRAHPSASDQRFAVAPRSPRDVRLGRLVDGEEALDGDDGSGGHGGSDPGSGPQGPSAGTVSSSIDSLAEFEGATVRVGGRLTVLHARSLTLDDGTGRVIVHLSEGIAIDPPLRLGEILNVSGSVRVRGTDRPELVVRTGDDVLRAATLTLGEDEGAVRSGLLAGTLDAMDDPSSGGPPVAPGPAAVGASTDGPPLVLLVLGAAVMLAGLALLGGAAATARPDLLVRLLGRQRPSAHDVGMRL